MSFGSPAKVVSCDSEHIFAFNLYSLGGSICHPLGNYFLFTLTSQKYFRAVKRLSYSAHLWKPKEKGILYVLLVYIVLKCLLRHFEE